MATRKRAPAAVSAEVVNITGREVAMGGGIEGARRNTAEMMRFTPPIQSPDQQINAVKELADARGRDVIQNDGLITGAVHTHRDSIVGSQYRLICTPDYEALGATEEWAIQFQRVVESRFNLLGDSTECWLDAAGTMTFTDMIRLGVASHLMTGEVLMSVEWLNDPLRPCKTAFQSISPTRLSNPDGSMDEPLLRAGVARDLRGKPKGYWIRNGFPGDYYMGDMPAWKYVPATTTWGRRQIIHIREQMQPDQTRGISDLVSVIKQQHMTKRFQDITLQNAVVNATYAAAIESELPSDVVFASMGAGNGGMGAMLGEYMGALTQYVNGTDKIAIDGVKMPHLFPGTKLNMKPAGTPGGIGTAFEQSLQRYIAAPIGLGYEQFSKDYTSTNYSSARASMSEVFKFMQARKKAGADRQATMMFVCWFEEEWMKPDSIIPRPKGADRSLFYDPIMREALVSCQWIGASRGQIDEVKETQAAIMRISAGLSTHQMECARLGDDFRRVFKQLSREKAMKEELGLEFGTDATQPGTNDRQQTMTGKQKSTEKEGATDE